MDLLSRLKTVFQGGQNAIQQAPQTLRGLGNRVTSNFQWAGQQAQRNLPTTTAFVKELYKGPQTFGKGFAETIRTAAPSVFGPSNLSLQQSYAKTLQDVGQKNIQRGYQTNKRTLVNSGQKLLNTGAQQYQGAAQGARQSAINVGLGGVQSAMPVFGAQYALKNPLIVGLGGTLSGAMNKAQGGSFREGFGQGAASMVRDSAIYQATNPLIAGFTGAAKTAGVLKTPLQKFVVGSVLSGIGNLGEDEITSKLLQNPRNAADRVLSFSLGAVASLGGGKIEDWKSLKKSTRTAIINAADKAGYLTKSAKDVWVGAPDVPAFLYDSWNQLKRAGWDGTPNFKNQGGFIDLNAEIFPKTKTDLSTQDVRKAMRGQTTPTTPKTDPTEALKVEAKKYKSAEEFVKAQAKKDYVLEVRKTTVNDIAKVGTYGEAGSAKTSARRKLASDITDKEIEIAQRDQKLFDTNKNKTIEQLQNEITETKKWADENNTSYPRSIQVKEEIIKTKSQLTDIWNKAQGAEPKFSPTKMTRQEKIAKDMLKRGDITAEGYNKIAMKNEGVKPIGIQNNIKLTPNMQSETKLKVEAGPANTSSQSFLSSGIPPQQVPSQQKTGGVIQQLGGGQSPPTKPPRGGLSDSQVQSSDDSISKIMSNVRNRMNELYTKTIDRFHPISMLAKEAGQEQATRNAMTGYYGAGSKAEYHVDFELTPILKEQNLTDLRKAAIAFRDIELSGRGIQGSNTGDPKAALKELESRLGVEKVRAIGDTLKKLYAYQDKMVKEYLVDTGVIGRQAYENMRANNQFYVPFKRVMDQVDDFLGVVPQTRNAGSVASQNVIKGIKGSAREIIDPIESIVEASYKMVNLGQRQKVAQQIVNLGKTKPGFITKIMGQVGNRPNIALFENGKVVHYAVPEEIAIAAKGLTDDAMNTLVKILQFPTKIFRASATGLNPEFAIPNVARDLQSAWVNYGLNPFTWARGLAHFIKRDDVYEEFLKSGGKTSFVAIDRPTIRKTVGDIEGKGISILHPKRLYDMASYLSEASEMGTRISLFENQLAKGLKQGLSKNEAAIRAAYAAQEGTVNFARRGADTKSINAIYAFLNARIQGVDRLMRSLKNDPKSAGMRLGFMVATPALGLYAWNRNFASYDDERVVSKSDRQNNFIIMLSDTPINQLGGAQYIKIPKAEVGKLANPLESFLAMLDGKDGKTKEALVAALKGFLPVDNVGDLIPTALRPPVEVAANKNFFFGSEIVPNYKLNYPSQYQYSSYTAPLYKMIGENLKVSPAKIQALVEGYATGWAKIGETATRPLIPSRYKTEKDNQGQPINRTPIIRRLLAGERRTMEEQGAIDEKG